MKSNSVKFFNPKTVTLTSVEGVEYDISAAVIAFSYYEDIFQPFVTGNLAMVDLSLIHI